MLVASAVRPSTAIARRSASEPIEALGVASFIPTRYTRKSSVARHSGDDAQYCLVYGDTMSSIHKRIRERREQLGLSQAKLGEMLGVGYQTVQQWETEPDPANPKVLSTAPKRTRMAQVAALLGVTETWLRTGHNGDGVQMDPVEGQLLMLYRQLPPEAQELLVQQANGLFTALNPGKRSSGNPFGGKKPPKKGDK